MNTRQGNMLTSQVAADSISLDSLSFSDLVCIQDQQPKLPSPNQVKHYQYQVSKHDPEFEFTCTKANFNSAANPVMITPADQLISNGQLQPQALASQTTQSLITNPHSSSSSLQPSRISSKMSRGKRGSTVKYHEQIGKASKRSTVKRTGFGQKMKSFLSPCRECGTIRQGAVKAQTVPGDNFKLY